jgi:hypothetical protein
MVEVNCGKCGNKMRLHKPHLVRGDGPLMSQVTLVPSWSVTERKCQSCGCLIFPVLAQEQMIGWMTAEQPAEAPRIVVPGDALKRQILSKVING